MSIERCADCAKAIDTDYRPEIYREEYNDTPLCDYCFDERQRDPATLLMDATFKALER